MTGVTPEQDDPPQNSLLRGHVVLDCRGRRCPLPILDLARTVREVPIGATVTIEADDPAAGPDILAWCRMRGQDYLGQTAAADGTPAYSVRRAQ
jgi:tRNA 2-thiouridine synthesizing protein A